MTPCSRSTKEHRVLIHFLCAQFFIIAAVSLIATLHLSSYEYQQRSMPLFKLHQQLACLHDHLGSYFASRYSAVVYTSQPKPLSERVSTLRSWPVDA